MNKIWIIPPKDLVEIIKMVESDFISRTSGKKLIDMFISNYYFLNNIGFSDKDYLKILSIEQGIWKLAKFLISWRKENA